VSTAEEMEFSMKVMANKAFRRILLELSSLPKSMGVLAVIAALSGLGTIIDQERVSTEVDEICEISSA